MAIPEKRDWHARGETPREFLLVIFPDKFGHAFPPKLYWTKNGLARAMVTNFGLPHAAPLIHEIWHVDLNEGTAVPLRDVGGC